MNDKIPDKYNQSKMMVESYHNENTTFSYIGDANDDGYGFMGEDPHTDGYGTLGGIQEGGHDIFAPRDATMLQTPAQVQQKESELRESRSKIYDNGFNMNVGDMNSIMNQYEGSIRYHIPVCQLSDIPRPIPQPNNGPHNNGPHNNGSHNNGPHNSSAYNRSSPCNRDRIYNELFGDDEM